MLELGGVCFGAFGGACFGIVLLCQGKQGVCHPRSSLLAGQDDLPQVLRAAASARGELPQEEVRAHEPAATQEVRVRCECGALVAM
jgi:hypothetical protein